MQSTDTIRSPVVLVLRLTRPTAKCGLTVGFYVEPVQFLYLGFYFRTSIEGIGVRLNRVLGVGRHSAMEDYEVRNRQAKQSRTRTDG